MIIFSKIQWKVIRIYMKLSRYYFLCKFALFLMIKIINKVKLRKFKDDILLIFLFAAKTTKKVLNK